MKEGFEGSKQEGEHDGEERIDHAKRRFLFGVAATVATVGAATVVPKIFHDGEEKNTSPEVLSRPYDVPVEQLSHDEAIREIVHDKGRIIRLGAIDTQGFQQLPDENDPDFAIRYFLDPYRASHTTPSHEEIQAEIGRLEQHIKILEHHRDATREAEGI